MAKISDTDLVWFGDSTNKDQMTLGIPGGPTANSGGLIFLECIDSSGDPSDGIYLFTDGTSLRYATSDPSNTNTGGSALDNTTIGAAANKALSNLASVAIAADVSPGVDSTYDLGASTPMYFAQSYIDRMYVNNTAYLDGASAGNVTLIGGLVAGSSGGATNADVKVFLHSANKFMVFDESADDIIIADATGLIFGGDESTADGVKFEFDGTATMNIDAITANDSITFGESTNTDVEFHGANDDIHWDASADTLRIADTLIVGFGTGASSDYDIGLAYAAANTLSWTQKVAGTGSILKGVDGKGIDETWYAETASDYMKWDQDGASNLGALTFEDSVILMNGTNSHYTLATATDTFAITATDHANSKVTIGTAGTTNSCDFQWLSKTSGDHITFDGGALTAVFDDIDTTILGKLTIGADADASNDDFKWFGTTTNKFVVFDESADDVIFADATGLILGGDESTADGLKMEFDGTSTISFSALTSNDTLVFGPGATGANLDVKMKGATSGADFHFDASADTVKLIGACKLDCASTSSFTGDATFLGGANAVTIGADGATQGGLTMWDGGGGNTPAYLLIHSPNGTGWYFFVEDDGTLKYHNASPTANADGSAVGDQTD